MKAAPGLIMLLIQIHCFPFRDQITTMNGSPAAEDWIEILLHHELIQVDPCCPPPDETRERCPYKTTERGAKHIENLGALNLPSRVWL